MAGISAEAAKDVVKPPPRPFLGGDTPKSAYITPTAEARTGKLSNVREIAAGLPELTGNNSQRTENVRNNEAKYGPQLMEGLQGALTTRFEQIGRLKNQDVKDNGATRKAYDLIREEARATHDPLFPIEETIFTMITDKDGKVDQQKVSDLLDDDRFKELSMRYLMIEKRKILEALGMRAIITPEGQRGNLHTLGRAIRMNIDQGNLDRLTNAIGNWLHDEGTTAGRDNGQPNWATAVMAAGAVGFAGRMAQVGALIGTGTPVGPWGGALIGGGLTALGEGALALVHRSMRPGLQVTFEQNSEILDYAKNSGIGQGTPQRDRLLYGVDPRDFVVHGNGLAIDEATVNTQLYGGRMHTTNLPGALNEALQILSMQAMWAEALNIDPQFVEDETQYLHVADPLNWRTASVPQTGERMLTDIHNAYIELVGGSGIPADYEARMNYLRQAESSVLEQRLHAILTDKSAEGESRRMDNLNSKLDSLNKDKPEYQARIQGQTKAKERIEQDKALVEEGKDKITSYQAELSALQKQRQDLRDRVRTFSTVGGPSFTDTVTAIAALEDVLKNPGATHIAGLVDADGKTLPDIESMVDRKAAAKTARDTALAAAAALTATTDPRSGRQTEDPKNFSERVRIAREDAYNQYNQEIQEITELSTLITGTIKSLRDQEKAVGAAEKNAQSSDKAKDAMGTVRTFGDDLATITRYGIPMAALRTDTLEHILSTINTLVPAPWPAAQNTLAQRRQLVFNAMAEARARSALRTNPNRATRRLIFNQAQAVGITTEELLTLTPDALAARYGTLYTSALASGKIRARPGFPSTHTANDMAEAQRWANEVLKARVDAVENLTTPMDTEINNLQLGIDASDAALEPIREEVHAAMEVVSSWQNGRTHEHALTILTEEENRQRLANTAVLLPTATGYTEAERTSHRTIGELEFLQLMTGYRDNPTGREEAFRQVQNIFDSEENRRALVTALDPYIPLGTAGWPPAPAAPFGDILDIFSPFITDSTLSPDVMYRVTGVVVNRIYQNAMTL